MGATKDVRGDTERARGEAAEESSAAQATHYHSRMEREEPPRIDDSPADAEGEGRGVVDEGRAPETSRVRAQPPEEFTGGEFEGASDASGGLAAVWSATKHIVREAGLVRGTRTLLRLNQKDGF